MSRTADIADSATAVQDVLTRAEQAGNLPDWYADLRNQIHGLVQSAAWAVGASDGVSIVGFRCDGRTHTAACVAYRAAVHPGDHDNATLTTCPKCGAEVHSLFEAGPLPYACWPCYNDN